MKMFLGWFFVASAAVAGAVALPEAVWLTYARNEPSHVTVNWVTEQACASVVRYGGNADCPSRTGSEEPTHLHQVEIPVPTRGDLFYRLEVGDGATEAVRFKGIPGDELRVAMAANWGFADADLSAVVKEEIHLLLTRGDHVAVLHNEQLTLNNEKSSVVRWLAKGEWGRLMQRGTLTATGFGYFAERGGTDGYSWFNSSLNGKGDIYRDPQSHFLAGEDSYLLIRFERKAETMSVEIKRLQDGELLEATRIRGASFSVRQTRRWQSGRCWRAMLLALQKQSSGVSSDLAG